MTQVGVGIVGCGGAGLDMSRAIEALPTAFVAATYDRDDRLAARLTARHGGVVHTSLDDLLADPRVEVVYVGVSHAWLAPTTHRALTAGRHVLVEKPMGLTVAAARELNRLAADRGLRLGVVFELREAESVRQARRIIHNGGIGSVRMVRVRTVIDKPSTYWHSDQPGGTFDSWRGRRAEAGGGVALMNSIHQLDTVRYVTGLSFVRAVAEVATLAVPVEVEDTAAAVFRLSNGALASLVAAAHSPGATREERIDIDGEFGRLDLPDPYGPGVVRLFLTRPWDGLPAGVWLDIDVETVDTHAALMARFIQAVRAGTPPTASGDDGVAALATVMAIYESAASGCVADVASADSA